MEVIKLRHLLVASVVGLVMHALGLQKEWVVVGVLVVFFGVALHDTIRRLADLKEMSLKKEGPPPLSSIPTNR